MLIHVRLSAPSIQELAAIRPRHEPPLAPNSPWCGSTLPTPIKFPEHHGLVAGTTLATGPTAVAKTVTASAKSRGVTGSGEFLGIIVRVARGSWFLNVLVRVRTLANSGE